MGSLEVKVKSAKSTGESTARIQDMAKKRIGKSNPDSEYSQLQEKYKRLQSYYNELKREKSVRENIRKLQQKCKAIQEKFNDLKKEKADASKVVQIKNKTNSLNVKSKKPTKLIPSMKYSNVGTATKNSKQTKRKSPRLAESVGIDLHKPAKQAVAINAETQTRRKTYEKLSQKSVVRNKILKCEKCKRIFALLSGLKKHTVMCPQT